LVEAVFKEQGVEIATLLKIPDTESTRFEVAFEIEQGVDMGRPSKIQITVVLDLKAGAVRKITLGGSAVQAMEGYLVI
jgi:predicted PhzF superfamily epimerase YddE/YHI9